MIRLHYKFLFISALIMRSFRVKLRPPSLNTSHFLADIPALQFGIIKKKIDKSITKKNNKLTQVV